MSQSASLRHVAIDLVTQYNATGKHLLNAWRAGAERLIQAPAAPVQLPLVSEQVQTQVAGTRDKVAGFLSQRLASDTALAARLMDNVAERSTRGIEAVAAATDRVSSEPGVSALRLLHDLHLPLAQLSLKLAGSIAEGAAKLEARLAQAESEAADAVSTVPVKATRRSRAQAA
ncbi:hypothetical protein PGB34_21250 [Xenophilus arseniciresistens]|uniref:Uncharacterized protein n=1 Tax=Xenophilus arseniciresistens TaxID=1283306 RepID=A0AAE3NFW1_9BURK|nr:hypothetical protein [Xenophilus arseniciresistens]MDA7418904.1 hypothetical protein [Xenophilus arseniciresistens]